MATLAISSFALFVWRGVRFWPFLLDDVLISLRYARNLAEGNGPIYQVGDRVEGYTNLLLVLLASAADYAGLAVLPILRG